MLELTTVISYKKDSEFEFCMGEVFIYSGKTESIKNKKFIILETNGFENPIRIEYLTEIQEFHYSILHPMFGLNEYFLMLKEISNSYIYNITKDDIVEIKDVSDFLKTNKDFFDET